MGPRAPLMWCLQETFTPQIACESGVPRLEGTPSWRHYTKGSCRNYCNKTDNYIFKAPKVGD